MKLHVVIAILSIIVTKTEAQLENNEFAISPNCSEVYRYAYI
jgi:hypothetical protein